MATKKGAKLPQDQFKLLTPTLTKTGSVAPSKKSRKKQASTSGAPSASFMSPMPGSVNALYLRPLDYNPMFSSPDRFLYPSDLKTANSYWRMFYKFDPIAGSVIDVYCEMPLSEYELIGEGVEGEIKDELTRMCESINLIKFLNANMVEFLVIGEAIPHLNYDSANKTWINWSLHKPEDVEVLDTHLIGMEPILKLTPSEAEVLKLKQFVQLSEKLGNVFPNLEFIKELVSSKSIILEPLNVTFLPRTLSAYDLRGTSIFSRLWRTFMLEDAIFNATLQTAKRHSAPVKTVTMGDLAAGFIPTNDQVRDLLAALAQSETDPQAWIKV